MKKLTKKQLSEHPLLDHEQIKLTLTFAKISAKKGESFTMLDFAQVALRATALDYTEARDRADASGETDAFVMADRDLKRAAILYVREALLASQEAIISEYPDLDNAVDLLTWLSQDSDVLAGGGGS